MEKERQNVSYGFLMVENLQQTIESSSPLRILSHQGYTSVSPIPSANPKFRKLSLFLQIPKGFPGLFDDRFDAR
jgi:hypothetical protein